MGKGHLWLRTALADKGYRQKDVARAWACDDAVVSRFIKTGEPELTWDRAEVLARMLGLDFNELRLRLAEGLPPPGRRDTPPASSAPERKPPTDPVKNALDDINTAVERARKLLPTAQINVSIKYGDK